MEDWPLEINTLVAEDRELLERGARLRGRLDSDRRNWRGGAVTTWRLLKRDEAEEIPHAYKRWLEVGTHQSEYDWSIGIDAASEIGSVHGAGEYLLLGNERCKELTIGERREFYTVDDEPDVPEPVSLKAAPSAAEIMEREG